MSRSINIVTASSNFRCEMHDLDTMAMPDLFLLFEEHMSLHGRSQLVEVIRNISNNNNQNINNQSNSTGLEDNGDGAMSDDMYDEDSADSTYDNSSLEESENSIFDDDDEDANS
jgi:hypothetical protein